MAGMGHQKKAKKMEYDCKECGKTLGHANICMMGRTWKSTRFQSYWVCSCGAPRVRIRGSGHRVVQEA